MADMQTQPAASRTTESARRAIKLLDDAEKRIDELFDAAEKLFNRGADYSERAHTWMNEHHDLKAKAEQIITKADEYRERLRHLGESAAESGESGYATVKAAGRERLTQLGARARRGVTEAGSFVRDYPADAILIGAAVGVLVGTAFKHLRGGESAEATEGGAPYGV